MRLAAEFKHKMAYTTALADIKTSDEPLYGTALAFQADLQTAGRGQHARNWESPKSGNCYVTFVMQCKN